MYAPAFDQAGLNWPSLVSRSRMREGAPLFTYLFFPVLIPAKQDMPEHVMTLFGSFPPYKGQVTVPQWNPVAGVDNYKVVYPFEGAGNRIGLKHCKGRL